MYNAGVKVISLVSSKAPDDDIGVVAAGDNFVLP